MYTGVDVWYPWLRFCFSVRRLSSRPSSNFRQIRLRLQRMEDGVPDSPSVAELRRLVQEGTPWTTPFIASIRLELTRYLVVEGEWTAPVRASEFIDTGDIGLRDLNGEVGIYGRDVRESSSELRMSAVNVLGRAQAKRFSFLGGVGIGFFERSD